MGWAESPQGRAWPDEKVGSFPSLVPSQKFNDFGLAPNIVTWRKKIPQSS